MLGCGSGRDTKVFLCNGYIVSAFDASPQMAAFASSYTGQVCSIGRFQDIKFEQEFDAVWACASLLHVSKIQMPEVLARLIAALKVGGVMYFSFIEGEGERTSADGRLYNSYTVESLRRLLLEYPSFKEIDFWKSEDGASPKRPAPWLNFLLKKIRSGL